MSAMNREVIVAINYLRFTIHHLPFFHLLRPLERLRSIEAMPPPEIMSASDIANNAIAYSYPPFWIEKPAGQRTELIAVAIVQAMRNAPTRVSSPRKTNMLPRSSENAAAPHQSQAGRIKPNGAGPELTNLFNPGPPKLPKTFSAPWKKNTVAKANLIGIVAHDEDVEIIFLNIKENPFTPREPETASQILKGKAQRAKGQSRLLDRLLLALRPLRSTRRGP